MISYLDNSATTRPTQGVIDAMTRCMRDGYFNPSSLYAPALDAEKAMRACREEVAGVLSVPSKGIYFTSGGTEANNLAILGSMAALHGKKRVIVSSVEHPSVLEAFRALEGMGHEVVVMPVTGDGQPDWAFLDGALDGETALVSCMQVNNETGAVPDIPRLVKMTREKAPNALIHVDGVQGFMRLPFDARLVDMYTLSGHKLHGPKGIGALYVRPGVRLLPRQIGGGQENAMRSGTENTPGIAGLHQAVVEMKAMGDVASALKAKKKLLWTLFSQAVPEAILNGPSLDEGAPHIVNISFPNVRSEVMLHALEGEGVMCSSGSACSSKKRKISPVLLAMGIAPNVAECALRFSLSPHTTEDEITCAAEKLGPIYATLKRYQRR